jgi:LUD domain
MPEAALAEVVDERVVNATAAGLRSRNIDVVRVATGAEAVRVVVDAIEPPARVISGGSRTVSQLHLPKILRATPGIDYVNDAVRAMDDGEERYAFRRASTASDYIVGSANAIVSDGRIVNVDGGGSRISSYAYAARRVIMIVSTNKICPTLDAAVDRVRSVAVRRVNERESTGLALAPCAHDGVCRESLCRPPVRECGKMLIIEKESVAGRILVVLVDEPIGY